MVVLITKLNLRVRKPYLLLSFHCSVLLASFMLDCELLPMENLQIFAFVSFAIRVKSLITRLGVQMSCFLTPSEPDLEGVCCMISAQVIQ